MRFVQCDEGFLCHFVQYHMLGYLLSSDNLKQHDALRHRTAYDFLSTVMGTLYWPQKGLKLFFFFLVTELNGLIQQRSDVLFLNAFCLSFVSPRLCCKN